MPPARFAPYREIAHEVATRLIEARQGCDPLAPWAEEVIVPSRGAAEAIAAELLARMPNGLQGLQLQSLETLATRILNAHGQTPRVANEGERRLAMRIAVRTIDDPIMTSRGIAAMLERSYRDLRDSGLTLADFARRAGKARLRNPRRTELVVRAWTEYERLIASLHAIDPADLFARAAAIVSSRAQSRDPLRKHETRSAGRGSLDFARDDTPQLLAGFYDMTGAQRMLAEALLRAERVAAIWIPTEAPFAQPFVRAVAPYAEVVREPVPERRQPDADVAAHDTRLDELRDVCARVAALLADGVPASEIGIVARSLEPYDVRLLNRFAGEHGFRTTLDEEIPLAAHRIGRGALLLLRLRERGFPRAEVLELVRDGLHTKTRIDVNEADKETRRVRIAGGTSEELARMRGRFRVIDDYIALVAELEELTATLDAAQLGSLFKVETQADLEAAEELDRIARLIAALKPTAPQDVIDAIEQTTLHKQPVTSNQQQLIWAGELLRFRGRAFTHLFVVRMQDDVFPQRRTEDPLLPDSDRRLLGLREVGDGREEEQLLFSLIGDAASDRVHFSYASGDGFGKVLRRSRFVRSCGAAAASAADEPGARSGRRSTAAPLRQLQLLVQSGTRSAFDGYIAGIDPSTLRLSPTQLEDFGECPQKFLLKHILGVRDIDHPERELQIHHRDKGILDHRILERFYRSMSDDDFATAHEALPRFPDFLGQRLDELVDTQFDEHEAEYPPFNRTVRDIERRATKRNLREFLVHDLSDLEAQSLVPRWFEYRFGEPSARHPKPGDAPPFIVTAGGVPVRVEGTIDRIDAGFDTFRIVDYKSGKALRHANLGDKIERGVRLQLALYAMAVAEIFDAEAGKVTATIKPLVIGEIKPAKFAFALHEKREALLQTLEIFIRAITNGAFPAFPNETDDFNSCKYCPVNHSCRTKHDLDERYAVQRHKDPRTLLGGAA